VLKAPKNLQKQNEKGRKPLENEQDKNSADTQLRDRGERGEEQGEDGKE